MSNPEPSYAATRMVRDACLCLHLQRASRAVGRQFDEAFRPLGLTSGQFSLLMSLNRPEPPTIGNVAALLAMDRTTLTANLKPLERRGLVAGANRRCRPAQPPSDPDRGGSGSAGRRAARLANPAPGHREPSGRLRCGCAARRVAGAFRMMRCRVVRRPAQRASVFLPGLSELEHELAWDMPGPERYGRPAKQSRIPGR